MINWRGFYPDTFIDCEAETEEQAQEIMKRKLLAMIEEEKEPFIVWENGDKDGN